MHRKKVSWLLRKIFCLDVMVFDCFTVHALCPRMVVDVYLLPRPPGSMWPRALSNALAPNPVAPNPVLSVRSVASLTPGGSGGKSAGLKGGFGEPVRDWIRDWISLESFWNEIFSSAIAIKLICQKLGFAHFWADALKELMTNAFTYRDIPPGEILPLFLLLHPPSQIDSQSWKIN